MDDVDILKLAKELGYKEIWIRRTCVNCGEFRLYLKLDQEKYECMACRTEGSLEKLKKKVYSDIMESRGSVEM